MKITAQILDDLAALGLLCVEGYDYIRQRNLIGATRQVFVEAVRLDSLSGVARADYYPWCLNTLVNSDYIKRRVEFVVTGKFRAVDMNGVSVECDTRDAARAALQAAWADAKLKERDTFNVHARWRQADGGYSFEVLDIDAANAPAADYYAAFNPNTGLYEEHDSAEAAKAQARNRRAMREADMAGSFWIDEQIRDDSAPEEVLTDWRFYESLVAPRP